LADLVVELVPGQTVLYERGLEHSDHVLTISMGCPQVAMARGRRVVWACARRHLP
jgi:hypothetical protein